MTGCSWTISVPNGQPVLQDLGNDGSLTHGDFNHRNIVLRNPEGIWEIAAILDWELAGTGSFLWDAARFMCYEKPDSEWWELFGIFSGSNLRLPAFVNKGKFRRLSEIEFRNPTCRS